MKCQLRIPMKRLNPEFSSVEAARRLQLCVPYRVPHTVQVPAGTVIDHKHAHFLVLRGIANPADDECQQVLDDHIAKHACEWDSQEEYLACMQDDYERLARGQATGNDFYDAEDDDESDDMD